MFVPFNSTASLFFVYAASFVPFAFRGRPLHASVTIVLVVAIIGIESWLITATRNVGHRHRLLIDHWLGKCVGVSAGHSQRAVAPCSTKSNTWPRPPSVNVLRATFTMCSAIHCQLSRRRNWRRD